MPVDAVYLWLLTRVLFCCTRGLGCNAHPAFPAPSLPRRVMMSSTRAFLAPRARCSCAVLTASFFPGSQHRQSPTILARDLRIGQAMRVFSVPVSVPFLHAVIAALIDGRLVEGFEARSNPARLADATLYLPTRRAMRLAREMFLDELNTDAAILPRIVALGDIDEDELAFAGEADAFGGAEPLDIPPKLAELDRRLTLAKLVAAWAKGPVLSPLVVGGPASTLALAGDLARLMDDMVTRAVGWEALDGLVPDQLDKYWQHSLEFLQIAQKAWPNHLLEISKIEPAARRDLLISAEAARLGAHHKGPVIAAGSTGSMPATAKFLHAVARLPQGPVVLPALDADLDG